MRKIIIPAVAALVVLGLTGCGDSGDTEMNKRYQQCLNAGGSFSEDYGHGWSCTLPTNE